MFIAFNYNRLQIELIATGPDPVQLDDGLEMDHLHKCGEFICVCMDPESQEVRSRRDSVCFSHFVTE